MRLLGKVLFVLYIGFIIYFLLFSDLYGRTGVMEEYRYNLVLFKEIKRFWQYREQLGWYVHKSFWKCDYFYAIWVLPADGE